VLQQQKQIFVAIEQVASSQSSSLVGIASFISGASMTFDDFLQFEVESSRRLLSTICEKRTRNVRQS